MSPERVASMLLRLYPSAWRERYGEELEALIVETSALRVPWRARFDVALAASRERLRSVGLVGDGAPQEQMRGGSLLVLRAWVLFVVAGTVVQKLSEHWQDVTPPASRELPARAFDTLVVAAALGCALVLTGIAVTLPSLLRFARGGGWPLVRRSIGLAALTSGAAALATVTLIGWAKGLTPSERNGHDLGYGIAYGAWALLLVACLGSWAAAAIATARKLELSPRVLALDALLAVAVVVVMGVMTAATVVWWGALAQAAPWFLAGRPVGTASSPLEPILVAAVVSMLAATLLGAAGASRAVRGLVASAACGRIGP